MSGRTIAEGELVMLQGGSDEDAYVHGIFRAARDIDLDVEEQRFLNQGMLVTGKPASLDAIHGMYPKPFGCQEVNFQKWLASEGLLEAVPLKALHVSWGGRGFDNDLADVQGEEPAVPRP